MRVQRRWGVPKDTTSLSAASLHKTELSKDSTKAACHDFGMLFASFMVRNRSSLPRTALTYSYSFEYGEAAIREWFVRGSNMIPKCTQLKRLARSIRSCSSHVSHITRCLPLPGHLRPQGCLTTASILRAHGSRVRTQAR